MLQCTGETDVVPSAIKLSSLFFGKKGDVSSFETIPNAP